MVAQFDVGADVNGGSDSRYSANDGSAARDTPAGDGSNISTNGTRPDDDDDWEEPQPLIIPITSSSSNNNNLFIEIFPEEIAATGTEDTIPASVLMQVLQDESAPMSTWSDAALLYYQHYKPREGLRLFQEACAQEQSLGGARTDKVRLLASMGIAHLSQIKGSLAMSPSTGGAGNDDRGKKTVASAVAKGAESGPTTEVLEMKTQAEDKFTAATRLDQLYPMTWVGKGMLNLLNRKLDQARYFFDTTLKHIGPVLPALLGMAAVDYLEGKYSNALAMYGNAIQLYPKQSGASVRVGFGMCCYKLGQVDRAKAAFARAHALDSKNVEAMASVAILALSEIVTSDPEFLEEQEHAIKLLSMANLMDRSNAMVQNHLADHFFWKWESVSGVKVSMTKGEKCLESNVALNLDSGDRIRIGASFETVVVSGPSGSNDHNMGEEQSTRIHLKDAWPTASADNLRLWKKDYDKVEDMAKAAYTSTGVSSIQAESLYHRARVMHVKGDVEEAAKCYARSCGLAPELTPSRWGLAQCQIALGQYEKAASSIKQVIQQSPQATEAYATLGLLQVHLSNTFDRKEALGNLKKSAELDPLNVDLVLLQALVFQTNKHEYSQALECYNKAVEMLKVRHARQGGDEDGTDGKQYSGIPAHVWTNIGVIHQELGNFDEALEMYEKAIDVLASRHAQMDSSDRRRAANWNGSDKCVIKEEANALFYEFVDSGVKVTTSDQTHENGLYGLKIIASDNQDLVGKVEVGDHIRLSENFKTEVKAIQLDSPESSVLFVADKFEPGSDDATEANDEESKSEKNNGEYNVHIKKPTPLLGYDVAVTIAFNLSRLHEDAGRSMAAVELLKAILQRHPSYVNCYLRLACIARDNGLLEDCSEWLKGAVEVAPQHAEVLTLVGNLHLSLCDWAPAQSLFDKLLAMKNTTVEAYSILSLGTIYFSNLNSTPGRYEKHLNYAADFYRRVLKLDKANSYAANGIGTVLAEKADLFHAKDIFNRVREVSNDGIPDSLLNLGHIYLAQKRYPESLQMYNNFMSKTSRSGLGKYANKEEAEVLLYIAFAYFDWARQTELFNNVKASAADDRYVKCIQHLEMAMEIQKDNMTLKYNWCMAKLVAANCVLQKLARNIPRTALEVQNAMDGLQEGLQTVQQMLKWKNENKKVPIGKAMLATFIAQCQANMQTAANHLQEELKKEEEAKEARELQRLEAEERRIARELKEQEAKEQKAKEEAMRERKARQKMDKVSNLMQGWEMESRQKEAAAEKKQRKGKGGANPQAFIDDDEIVEEVAVHETAHLFDDGSDSEEEGEVPQGRRDSQPAVEAKPAHNSDDNEAEDTKNIDSKDLFGESSDDESDEELLPTKRKDRDSDDEQSNKKQKFGDDG